MASRLTPAQRARQRQLTAQLRTPPKPATLDRRALVDDLEVVVAGQPYLIGPNLEGDVDTSQISDGAETITLKIRDVDGALADALPDQAQILEDPLGVTVTLDGVVFALQTVNDDGQGLLTLTMGDEVQARLQLYSSFLSVSRDQSTFRQFALRLVKEASGPPLAPISAYIPELNDPQPIARATGTATAKKGTGADGRYTVKGKAASTSQLAVIDGILTRCRSDDASRLVMIAAIMAATQESTMGDQANVTTGNDDTGIYQQGRNWISVAGARDPSRATHAFLVTGPTSWKKVHGSTRTAKGDLETLIKQVQISVGGYARWETEATKTVDQWLNTAGDISVTRAVEYDFTRGEQKGGTRETSWDCLARLADERNVRRWAAGNVLYLVSDNELRAGAPSLEIHGDEPWLLQWPSYDWNPGRPVTELQIKVLADQWAIQAGASVLLRGRPVEGRFLVSEVAGGYISPERTVTLRRPTPQKKEPAHDINQLSITAADAGDAANLPAACKDIDGLNLPYVWGGGHAKCGTPDNGTGRDPGIGYDCSGSTAAALAHAGIGTLKIGQPVPASNVYAEQHLKKGPGSDYTVWANPIHIWIELRNAGRYVSFDTRPTDGGKRGPHLRTVIGSKSGFTAYH